MSTTPRVLFVTPEIAPWQKTGGLGDVAASLPEALHALGADVRVLVPAYPALYEAFPDAGVVAEFPPQGGLLPACRLLQAESPGGLTLYLLACAEYYRRPGSPYQTPDGLDWPDNFLRFALLSKIAAQLACFNSPLVWRPQVVHAHDWQAGLTPAYLRYLPQPRAATVMTLHNLAFQGNFPPAVLDDIDLPRECYQPDGMEFYGNVSYLKAGLVYANRITTVSPTYAGEIQTEALGFGLAGLLRQRAAHLSGILNGIDLTVWDPARDPLIAARYDAGHLASKAANKAALQQQLGLDMVDTAPLLGVVSRLTYQKGLDWLVDITPQLVQRGAQLALLGSGEILMQDAFIDLAARHPGRIAVTLAFDETLAHRIEAGADMFLMPSRFEPCGLNQMYSLRYGTPPVVRATGGLADTVIDCNAATLEAGTANGFVFVDASAGALLGAIERALETWRDRRVWQQLQHSGMRREFGWRLAAQAYLNVYGELVAQSK